MENQEQNLENLKINSMKDILGIIGGLSLLVSPYLAYRLYKDTLKFK